MKVRNIANPRLDLHVCSFYCEPDKHIHADEGYICGMLFALSKADLLTWLNIYGRYPILDVIEAHEVNEEQFLLRACQDDPARMQAVLKQSYRCVIFLTRMELSGESAR